MQMPRARPVDLLDDGEWLERQKMSQVLTVVGEVASRIGYVCLGAGYMWEISAPFQHCMNLELLWEQEH